MRIDCVETGECLCGFVCFVNIAQITHGEGEETFLYNIFIYAIFLSNSVSVEIEQCRSTFCNTVKNFSTELNFSSSHLKFYIWQIIYNIAYIHSQHHVCSFNISVNTVPHSRRNTKNTEMTKTTEMDTDIPKPAKQ